MTILKRDDIIAKINEPYIKPVGLTYNAIIKVAEGYGITAPNIYEDHRERTVIVILDGYKWWQRKCKTKRMIQKHLNCIQPVGIKTIVLNR